MLSDIREAITLKRIEFQKHALKRLIEENFTVDSVLNAILAGEIIKEYPDDRPYPSVLILGFHEERPVHVVCAYNADTAKVHIITNYQPTLEYYEPDFITRRRSE